MAVVECLNALGVALQANPSSSGGQQHLGSQLILAAIAIQAGVIVAFLAMAGVFHRRCRGARVLTTKVKTPLVTLYASMLLIGVRCVYCLVEHLGSTAIDVKSEEKLRQLTPTLRYECRAQRDYQPACWPVRFFP